MVIPLNQWHFGLQFLKKISGKLWTVSNLYPINGTCKIRFTTLYKQNAYVCKVGTKNPWRDLNKTHS